MFFDKMANNMTDTAGECIFISQVLLPYLVPLLNAYIQPYYPLALKLGTKSTNSLIPVDFNAGLTFGYRDAIFKLSGAVMSDPCALGCVLSIICIITATIIVVRAPLNANPGLAPLMLLIARMLAIMGIAMGTAGFVVGTAFAAMALPNNK